MQSNDAVSESPVLDYARPPRSRLTRIFTSPWLLLPLILLLAVFLRWAWLGSESLWLDEFLAMQNSTGRGQLHVTFPRDVILDPAPPLTTLEDGPGFWRIWTSLDTESHPPLYFMALNLWRHVFGEGDVAARWMSVAFSLLSIVLLFDTARLLHGTPVGLWAALLMALAGPQIEYAQEARNYTMLLALTLGACDAVVRLEKLGATVARAAALGACVLAMMLTHYLAIWPAVAVAIYAAIRLRGRGLRLTVGAFACAGIIFLAAWGPFLLEQSRGITGEVSFSRSDSVDVGLTLKRAALLPLRYFTEPMKRSIDIGYMGAVMYVIPLFLLWRRRDLLLWCLLGGVMIGAIFVSDLVRPGHALSYVRYTLVAGAAVYALAAGMLWHMKGFFRHLVPLVLAVACIAAIEEAYARPKADTREMAAHLAGRLDPDDILVIHTLPINHDWQARSLYLGLAHYTDVPCPIVFLSAPPPPDAAERIRSAREVYVIAPSNDIPLNQLLPGARMLDAAFFPYVGIAQRVTW